MKLLAFILPVKRGAPVIKRLWSVVFAIVAGLLLTLLLGGCTLLTKAQLDAQYGAPDPGNRGAQQARTASIDYWRDVKPILDGRCVVCHGCYDAPCQLKLGAYEGIERGASKERVYNPARLRAAPPSRLFFDAKTPRQWRERGFYPVLNERGQSPQANLEAGVMARILLLKRQHPLPETMPLPGSFDFSLNRKQQCATIEEFDAFARRKPLWGMPYGLPGLTENEFGTLYDWLYQGAPYEAPPPLAYGVQAQVAVWEAFLNGKTNKQRLMSRYLYEHLFLANLYFSNLSQRVFFRLIRSRTPPGEAIVPIVTRRPYDDPGKAAFYYRLEPLRTTVLAKTHMPYALNDARMARYKTLFLAADYDVAQLPSYAPETASNPFATFEAIPVDSRYRFLLDEAAFLIMGFIKGPVCRGQVALNVIDDHFWVVFHNPNSPGFKGGAKFLSRELRNLRLPSEAQSNTLLLSPWLKYSRLENKYLKAKTRYMDANLAKPGAISLDLVWDGDGWNDNAALTVFRHFDSASVVKGFLGDDPKTFWVIDYPMLERIHYLLVAGFDVYGNVGHQLNTRLYMDFLRMEGEFNALTLLPREKRVETWSYWYRGGKPHVLDFIHERMADFDRQSGIVFTSDDPQRELYSMLRARLGPVLNRDYDIAENEDGFIRENLQELSRVRGQALYWLPQVAFLSISDGQGSEHIYTLIHNNGMSNVSSLLQDEQRRLPSEDSLTVARGFIGAYPNVFYQVGRDELPDFVQAIASLDSEANYQAFLGRFGIRRNDPRFWEHSDALHAAYLELAPVEAGLFDYNRLENR